MAKPPKLAEVARRISEHLHRFEREQTPKSGRFFFANAWEAGSHVGVTYVSYQGKSFLTKADALAYLAWLDAGNRGKHWRVATVGDAERVDSPTCETPRA